MVGFEFIDTLVGVFSGWLLALITPIIVDTYKDWRDKKICKKILKKDVENKINLIERNISEIIKNYNVSSLDDANESIRGIDNIEKLWFPRGEFSSSDFFKERYAKIIKFFENFGTIQDFYERFSDLNSDIRYIEGEQNPPINVYRNHLIYFNKLLESALEKGRNAMDELYRIK